ncbi:MAG TPA: ShlB/FhaC/HecB family hemolysin secretion/activation protein [Nitrospiraceae bacterium]|nr:ShlB/FhaC/HecB family hemolysin secretion/activation protein [Nitrospiraceae bacterium]
MAYLNGKVKPQTMGRRSCDTIQRAGWGVIVSIVTLLVNPSLSLADPATAADSLLVKGFSFSGNTVVSQADLEALTQPYVGQALDLPALEQVAESVAEHYRHRGYTLASAYIPQQSIQFGVVEIAILEGRLGAISVSGNRFYSTEFIYSRFANAMEERVIRNVALERALLLLNDYPDLKVSAVLEPGRSTGSTNIQANVEDKRPLHASLDFNNYGFNTISRYRFGAGVEVGNVLFDGATLNLNGIMGNHPDQLLFGTGAYSVPVGVHGTKLVFSGSGGLFNVGAELAALGIEGRIQTFDLSVTHPFIKTRFQSLLGEFGLAAKNNQLFTLGAMTADDQIRELKFGVNYDRLDLSGRTYLSLYGFQGLGQALGGMQNNDPQTSRQGADDRFTKGTLMAGRIQSLGHDSLLILRATGQLTNRPLVVIEQMLLGGPDSVRGYQLGEKFFDEGYTVSAEVRVPFIPSLLPVPLRSTQVAAFIDNGGGRLLKPAAGEASSGNLTGTGIGMQTELPYYSTRLRVDVGFPLGPKPSGGTISGDRSPTVYLQAMMRF